MKQKWNDDDRFAFSTAKLRSTKIPNKKRDDNRKACRRWTAE